MNGREKLTVVRSTFWRMLYACPQMGAVLAFVCLLPFRPALDELAGLVGNARIKQTGEVGHPAQFGFRRLGFGVQRTAYRQMPARRNPADADLVGLQAEFRRLAPEDANGLPAIGPNGALVVLPRAGRIHRGRAGSVLQDQ